MSIKAFLSYSNPCSDKHYAWENARKHYNDKSGLAKASAFIAISGAALFSLIAGAFTLFTCTTRLFSWSIRKITALDPDTLPLAAAAANAAAHTILGDSASSSSSSDSVADAVVDEPSSSSSSVEEPAVPPLRTNSDRAKQALTELFKGSLFDQIELTPYPSSVPLGYFPSRELMDRLIMKGSTEWEERAVVAISIKVTCVLNTEYREQLNKTSNACLTARDNDLHGELHVYNDLNKTDGWRQQGHSFSSPSIFTSSNKEENLNKLKTLLREGEVVDNNGVLWKIDTVFNLKDWGKDFIALLVSNRA